MAVANNTLYAANFRAGTVDAFDNQYNPVAISGGFTDPNLPAGYAPFGIQNFNGNLFVRYALQDADKEDDVPGAGNGFVDVFDANGHLMQRLISNGALNSPWGLALAPSNFGAFSSDLLVGNFGDGRINAFDVATGSFLGTISDSAGTPLPTMDPGDSHLGMGVMVSTP